MTEWLPTERLLTVIVAPPPVRVTGMPAWLSMKKLTEPVGVGGVVPPTPGETVAETVTGCPNTDGLGAEVTVVVVRCSTVSGSWNAWYDGFSTPETVSTPLCQRLMSGSS